MIFEDLLDVLGLEKCIDAVQDIVIELHLKNPFYWT